MALPRWPSGEDSAFQCMGYGFSAKHKTEAIKTFKMVHIKKNLKRKKEKKCSLSPGCWLQNNQLLGSGHTRASGSCMQDRSWQSQWGSLNSSCLSPHLAPAAQDLGPKEKSHPSSFQVLTASLMPCGGHCQPQCCQVFLTSCQGPHAHLALTPLSGLTRPLSWPRPHDLPLLFT